MSDQSNKNDRFTAVVFGATGFTGQYVLKDLLKHVADSSSANKITVAAAGRNESAVRNIVRKMAPSDAVAKGVGVIVADCKDERSLVEMAQRATVVLDCVGPYRFFGEPVVKACLAGGAHYLDISGEPQFMESMQLKYDAEAKKKNLFIISACAFDCIPADIGSLFTETLFSGEGGKLVPGNKCASIESFLTLKTGPSGFAGHFATFESAVHGFGDQLSLIKTRKGLSAAREQKEKERASQGPRLPSGPPPPRRSGPFYDNRVRKWCLPFPGADPSVVKRSQTTFAEESAAEGGYRGEAAPVHYAAYFTIPSFYYLVIFLILGFFFKILATKSWGRKILLSNPGFFTNGVFSHAGPTEEQLKQTSFEMTMFANGYESSVVSPTEKPNKKIVVQVSGPEPGYVATPILFVQCFKVLVEEVITGSHSRCKGGVVTPSVAFAGTTIVERLQAAGIKFTVAK